MKNNATALMSFFIHKQIHQWILILLLIFILISITSHIQIIYNEVSLQKVAENPAHLSLEGTIKKKFNADDFQLLFGFNKRTEPTPEKKNIPQTTLNLQLHGAMTSLQPNIKNSAIIKSTHLEKVYYAGDTLPGGAKLTTVYADHVVLNRNGRFETLFFPNNEKYAKGTEIFTHHNPQHSNITTGTDTHSLEERMLKLREQLQQAMQ